MLVNRLSRYILILLLTANLPLCNNPKNNTEVAKFGKTISQNVPGITHCLLAKGRYVDQLA